MRERVEVPLGPLARKSSPALIRRGALPPGTTTETIAMIEGRAPAAGEALSSQMDP